jgi:hypothetical protein
MQVVGFVTKYAYENIVAFVEQQCVKTTNKFRVARLIPRPRFDGCIWGFVSSILVATKT